MTSIELPTSTPYLLNLQGNAYSRIRSRPIRACPNVRMIEFYPQYDAEGPSPQVGRWCKDRSGILIRSYTNGTDELFHYQTFSRSKLWTKFDVSTALPNQIRFGESARYHHGFYWEHQVTGRLWVNLYVIAKTPSWEESVSFSCRCVPEEVIAKVFHLAGEQWLNDWTTPERDLTLPERAWELLTPWRQLVDGTEETYGGWQEVYGEEIWDEIDRRWQLETSKSQARI